MGFEACARVEGTKTVVVRSRQDFIPVESKRSEEICVEFAKKPTEAEARRKIEQAATEKLYSKITVADNIRIAKAFSISAFAKVFAEAAQLTGKEKLDF